MARPVPSVEPTTRERPAAPPTVTLERPWPSISAAPPCSPRPVCNGICFGGEDREWEEYPAGEDLVAQEGEAAGLGWSSQNSNSGEEEEALLLLASAASMAAREWEEPAYVCLL